MLFQQKGTWLQIPDESRLPPLFSFDDLFFGQLLS
jgi:hypothetical protein